MDDLVFVYGGNDCGLRDQFYLCLPDQEVFIYPEKKDTSQRKD
jgi:hypothetical protein